MKEKLKSYWELWIVLFVMGLFGLYSFWRYHALQARMDRVLSDLAPVDQTAAATDPFAHSFAAGYFWLTTGMALWVIVPVLIVVLFILLCRKMNH